MPTLGSTGEEAGVFDMAAGGVLNQLALRYVDVSNAETRHG